MDSEEYHDSPTAIVWPLNEPGGILENLTSQNEDDLHSILSIAEFNANLYSSSALGNSSSSGNISLPSYQMSLSSHDPFNNNIYTDHVFSQFRERDSKKRHLDSPNLHRATKVQTRGIDVNQESIQEFLLKEKIKHYKQQMQIQPPASDFRGFRIPKQEVRSGFQEQDNEEEIFAPLLDGGLCSRRFKQYLYHLRNYKHETDISYWRKFVSEYFAPGSKKRWCFSKYENIELHTAGVFCPKSMETWSCELCGLKSGRGLEATFEIFPRLLKIKFESGMVDDILYLDSPRACKVARGVVLEYTKAIQETVYQTFRVAHRGKLRITFGHDLKISSWDFCIENHDEYLQRTTFSPQVIMLDKAVEKYQDIQNRSSSKASSQDLRKVCDMFTLAGTKILENMDLPLVNDLGYPKRLIRCLQIGEVVDSMKDLITFSHNTKVGPIESLKNYSQGINTLINQMKGKQQMEQPESPGSLLGQLNLSARRYGQQEACMMDQSSVGLGQSFNSYLYNEALPSSSHQPKTRDQALFDKLICEMVGSSSRGKSVQEMYEEVVQRSNHQFGTSDESTAVILSHEPYLPEQSSAARIGDFMGSFSGKATY